MSTQPTPGALSAADYLHARYAITRDDFPMGCVSPKEIAEHIDREAVKPATAELLEALKELRAAIFNCREVAKRNGNGLLEAKCSLFLGQPKALAAIAKHEART